MIQISALEATVIEMDHSDIVRVKTDLPDPLGTDGHLAIEFEAAKGKGAEYVRKYFKLEPGGV